MNGAAHDAGAAGAAAVIVWTVYASGGPAGHRAAIARAARAGASRPRPAPHHAPPYPVPVASWRGRAW